MMGDLTVWVVDNGSRSEEKRGLRALCGTHGAQLIQMSGNHGFGAACNVGCLMTRQPYTLFLNPDARATPDALRAALARMENDSEIGILGVRLTREDGSHDHAMKRADPTIINSAFYLAGRERFLHRLGGRTYSALHVHPMGKGIVDAVNGAFMLCRTEALEAVGGFDTRYWMYAEDLDLCRSVRGIGYKVEYDGTIEAQHIKHGTTGARRSGRPLQAFYSSMWKYYTKWGRSLLARLGRIPVGAALIILYLTERLRPRDEVGRSQQ